MCILRNWQVTFSLYTLGVFLSEYTAKALRNHATIAWFSVYKNPRNLAVSGIAPAQAAGVGLTEGLDFPVFISHKSRNNREGFGNKTAQNLRLCPARPEISLFPVLPAEADIAVVGAKDDLFPLFQHYSVFVKASVEDSLLAAPADGLDFFNDIRPGQQSLGTREQVTAEIGTESVADHGDTQPVHDIGNKPNIIPAEELGLVNDDALPGLDLIFRHGSELGEIDAVVLESDSG